MTLAEKMTLHPPIELPPVWTFAMRLQLRLFTKGHTCYATPLFGEEAPGQEGAARPVKDVVRGFLLGLSHPQK